MMRIVWPASIILALTSIAYPAFSQVQFPADAYQVSYAANLPAGFSTINITNADGGKDPNGDICVNVYAFAEDQQLIACCACLLTPNHLKSMSALDLLANTLTPGVPIGITIGLLATSNPTGAACDAGHVSATNLASGMRAWSTEVHQAPGGGFALTENHFLPAPLSPSEFNKLSSYCSFIEADGSGYGICKSCSPGAAGAAKQ